jgi:hypothetical protein
MTVCVKVTAYYEPGKPVCGSSHMLVPSQVAQLEKKGYKPAVFECPAHSH